MTSRLILFVKSALDILNLPFDIFHLFFFLLLNLFQSTDNVAVIANPSFNPFIIIHHIFNYSEHHLYQIFKLYYDFNFEHVRLELSIQNLKTIALLLNDRILVAIQISIVLVQVQLNLFDIYDQILKLFNYFRFS